MLLIRKYDLSLGSPSTQDHDYSDIPDIIVLSEFKSSAITYIAGYVVRVTRKFLSCGECAASLTTGTVMASSFLEKKKQRWAGQSCSRLSKSVKRQRNVFRGWWVTSLKHASMPRRSVKRHIIIREWTTSLDTSSRTLFVREGGRDNVSPDVHVTSSYVITSDCY